MLYSSSRQADVPLSRCSLQRLLEESEQVIRGASGHSSSTPPSVLAHDHLATHLLHPQRHQTCHRCQTTTPQKVGKRSASGGVLLCSTIWCFCWVSRWAVPPFGLGVLRRNVLLLSFIFQQVGATPPTACPPHQPDTWTASPGFTRDGTISGTEPSCTNRQSQCY